MRINRRYFYNDLGPADQGSMLTKARVCTAIRRRPALLQARGAGVVKELSTSKVYNFPNRKQLTFFSAEAHAQQNTTRARATQGTPQHTIESARSILQHRTARRRVVSYRYTADRVLRKLPFALGLAPKRAGRVGKKAFSLLTKLEGKRDTYLRLLRYAPVIKKGPYQVLFSRAQRTLQRTRNRLATFKALKTYLPAVQGGKSHAPELFSNRTFRYLAAHRRFTKNCMRLQAARRGMIFDTSRPRL